MNRLPHTLAIGLFALCCACCLLGCPVQSPTERPAPADAGVVDSGPSQTAFVLSMWEESGAFGLLDVKSKRPRPQVGPASNDAVARYYGGKIYIVNRLTHDNIQVMDTRDWRLLKQYSVGPKSNPQDIVVLNEEKAYVSRLADPRLLIVAPLTGKKLGEIDLRSLSETGETACNSDADCDSSACLKGVCARDGIPELARMHLYKGKLFVLVQRLDRNARFDAKDQGMIAVIDTKTDTLLTTMPTKGRNPIQLISSDAGRRLFVGEVGQWIKAGKPVLDGMIEVFDLDAMKSEGVLLTEAALGGNLSSFAVAPQRGADGTYRGFAIRSNGQWQTELVAFSSQVGGVPKVETPLASSDCVSQGACFGFFQIVLNASGELYLVDRNLKKPGIRVFDASSGKEVTKAPIDMGLPPSSLLFFPPM